MTEHEYHQLAEALMFTIEEQVDDCEADLDYENIDFNNKTHVLDQ